MCSAYRFCSCRPACLTTRSSGEPLTVQKADTLMARGPDTFPVLKGPATIGESLRAVGARTGGGFVTSHDRWLVEARIEHTNRSKYEHKVLSRVLDLAILVDGHNVKRSVGWEYVNRRMQLIEEAHREDPSRPCFEASHLYMGEDDEWGGAHMSGALRAHVAAEMGREAAIAKEKRKAHESARGRAPGGKGAGAKGAKKEGE